MSRQRLTDSFKHTVQATVHIGFFRTLLCALTLGLLVACTAYKPDVGQGNIITAAQINTLKVGMTRPQVVQALGSPLLQDIFNGYRWDYVYRTLSGKDVLEQRVFTVFFDANYTVQRWAGQEATGQAHASPAGSSASAPTTATAATVIAAPLLIPPYPVAAVPASPAPAKAANTNSNNNANTMPGLINPMTTTAADVNVQLRKRIESWKNAWSKADTQAYSEHYATGYKGDLASPAAWLAQRKRVMKDAGDIKIELSDINIIQTSPTEARATFVQQYQSRRLKETGEKSLFFQRDERGGQQWKIVAERFVK